jgi:hypothetical protein
MAVVILYAASGPDRCFRVHRTVDGQPRALCGYTPRLGWFDVRRAPIFGQRPCEYCERMARQQVTV